jgi:hypothetical protein
MATLRLSMCTKWICGGSGVALLATGAPLASIAAFASIDLRPGGAWHGRPLPLPLRLRLGGAWRDLPVAGILLCVLAARLAQPAMYFLFQASQNAMIENKSGKLFSFATM